MFERLARIVVLAVIGCFSLAGAATAADFGDVVGRAQNVTTSDMTMNHPLPPTDMYRSLKGESLDGDFRLRARFSRDATVPAAQSSATAISS